MNDLDTRIQHAGAEFESLVKASMAPFDDERKIGEAEYNDTAPILRMFWVTGTPSYYESRREVAVAHLLDAYDVSGEVLDTRSDASRFLGRVVRSAEPSSQHVARELDLIRSLPQMQFAAGIRPIATGFSRTKPGQMWLKSLRNEGFMNFNNNSITSRVAVAAAVKAVDHTIETPEQQIPGFHGKRVPKSQIHTLPDTDPTQLQDLYEVLANGREAPEVPEIRAFGRPKVVRDAFSLRHLGIDRNVRVKIKGPGDKGGAGEFDVDYVAAQAVVQVH